MAGAIKGAKQCEMNFENYVQMVHTKKNGVAYDNNVKLLWQNEESAYLKFILAAEAERPKGCPREDSKISKAQKCASEVKPKR